MRLRSLLFVPGDRPDRIQKALRTGADALILDLEDAVAIGQKHKARQEIAAALSDRHEHGVQLFVRINPIDSEFHEDDLSLVLLNPPDAIVLPKAEGAPSIKTLVARCGDSIPILPITNETPGAIFELGSFRDVKSQLVGLTWGGEDLSMSLGAATSRDADGVLMPALALARNLTLFAAQAAEVAPIETVFPDLRDAQGLSDYAHRAARDGFAGMMAIHPDQVGSINAAFTPSGEEIEHAQAVVAAFADNPNAGVLRIHGKMVDAPHLKRALLLLARAGPGTL